MQRIQPRAAVLVLAALCLGGCDWQTLQPQTARVEEDPLTHEGESTYLSKTAIREETPTPPQGDDAVNIALQWAQRCSELSQQLGRVEDQNSLLQKEKQDLQQKVVKLEADLKLAEKELQEANNMLIELQRHLEQWKDNVLGFRQEMRQAQKAELDALTKVLRLLGGQVAEPAVAKAPEEPKEPAPWPETKEPKTPAPLQETKEPTESPAPTSRAVRPQPVAPTTQPAGKESDEAAR